VPEANEVIPELEIKEVPARRVAFVRERARRDEMERVVPRNIDRVAHAIGMRHAGPPFGRFPDADEDGYLEAEVGWPVPEDVQVKAPVEIATYEATRALVMRHVGPFEDLGRSYRLMAETMERQGLVPAGEPVDWYESNPEEVTDPKDYVTIIEWPIE
jgi:effector-binding domain-containing protein